MKTVEVLEKMLLVSIHPYEYQEVKSAIWKR